MVQMGRTPRKEMVGTRVGHLRILSYAGGQNGAMWNYVCDCGTKGKAKGAHLRKWSKGSCSWSCPERLKDEFWKKKRVLANGCWDWTGGRSSDGYGQVRWYRRALRAHRVAYALAKGLIPKNLLVCHSCDNILCINPEHLWLGTVKANTQDMIRKGRFRPHGKPYYPPGFNFGHDAEPMDVALFPSRAARFQNVLRAAKSAVA
jgi:hypothetical protein